MFARPLRTATTRHLFSPRSQLRFTITARTMATSQTILKLNTGQAFPAVGFGTWQDKESQESAVLEALKAGYRHIDTARIYGTEPAVGAAIKKSGVPREDIFVTTKLWNHKHHPEDVAPALDASLADLGTGYVDLYLMHWPNAFRRGDDPFPKDGGDVAKQEPVDFVDTYKAMEKLLQSGKAKAIGVSNFSLAEMQRLLKETSVVPASHQIELHPYLQQKSFVDFHRQHGIVITQYSPFGNQNEIYSKGQSMGKLIEDPVIAEIGKKYNKSGAQVALAWGINHGHSVIPKSKTPQRIKDNLGGDFKLEPEDLKKLDGLDKKLRFNDASKSFGYDYFKDLDGKEEPLYFS